MSEPQQDTAKILIRLTPKEHAALKNAAWLEKVSLQEFCRRDLLIVAKATTMRHQQATDTKGER